MKKVKYSTKAKKDLKRYRHDVAKMRKFYEVLDIIRRDQPVPAWYFPHKLTGQYTGCMECHVGSDFLLIWVSNEVVEVVRLGTHSELF